MDTTLLSPPGRVSPEAAGPEGNGIGERGGGVEADGLAATVCGVLDAAEVPMALVADDGCILYVNDAFCTLTSFERADLVGAEFEAIVHTDDLEDALRLHRLVLAGAIEAGRRREQVRAAHGGVLAVEETASIVQSEAGGEAFVLAQFSPAGGVGTAPGLSDEVEALRREVESLRRQLGRRDEALAHTSHELRSPLGALCAALELLADDDSSSLSVHARRCLEIAERNASLIDLLAGDLIDDTAVRTGKLSVEMTSTPVAPLVSDVVEALATRAAARGIELRVEVADSVGRMHADGNRIMQVLANLVVNACKFTPPDGQVTVSAALTAGLDGELVRFGVTDTGPGLGPDEADRVFERLYQVGTSSDVPGGGFGIGLYLCRQLVEAHRGVIWCESAPGAGAAFYFTIPAAVLED